MSREAIILGAGMHEWGKWGRNFVEYGVVAAERALQDAGIQWTDVQYVAGAATVRNGYPGYVAGATFAQALGWNGAQISTSYAACASGAQAIAQARAQIQAGLCDVALVIGSDTTPKGFLAPTGGERWHDPDWLRFRLQGITNPTYFGLYARRRMDLYGATEHDFNLVKMKNAKNGLHNPYARYKKAFTEEDILKSPMVADPLRLLHICATSDGAAALIVVSDDWAKKHAKRHDGVRIRAVATTTPTYPQTTIEMPNFATDSSSGQPEPALSFKASVAHDAYEQAGLGPDDLSLAEVYDLSSALELDWYEHIGIAKEGEAETLVRSGATNISGKIPVNASGGLSCFGEAVPAQAIQQVCELTWQIRGEAQGRQVDGARVGLAINQGLFGHGSCTIISRD